MASTRAGGFDLEAAIAAARRLPGRPHEQRLTSWRSLGELLAARAAGRGAEEYLVYYGEDGRRSSWTTAEFARRVASTARYLLRQGVARGDRIATVSHNHADTVVHYFAAWSIGAVVVPINVGEDAERIHYILANSGARLAFVRALYLETIEALRARLPELRAIVVCGDHEGGYPHFDEVLGTEPLDELDDEPGLDDEALIVYTSGTTGHPKGVVLTQYNLLVDAEQIASWHELAPGDRMMCVLPIHHVNGTVVTLVTPLVYGGAAVLNRKFQTGTFFERLARERIAIVSVVPTLLSYLLQGGASLAGLDLSSFRHIICGAGPLTVDLARAFAERFNLRVVHGYGLSETTCYSCFLPPRLEAAEQRRWMESYGFPSIGPPLPCNEMDIHDPDGGSLPDGERGEIVIRGHNVMERYFRNDEANAGAFTHGWFRSGDEGFAQRDEQGRRFFFITGRIKELIIRGGVNISPLEIDEILMSLPGVAAGVAVGFENDVYGEEVGAYIVPLEGHELDSTAILHACRERLPHHKCPKAVVFGSEVPVTSTGKYRRNQLKPLFATWRAAQFRDHA